IPKSCQTTIFYPPKRSELCKFAVWTKATKATLSALSAGRSGRTGQDTRRVSCPSAGSNLSYVLSVHLSVCVFRGSISAGIISPAAQLIFPAQPDIILQRALAGRRARRGCPVQGPAFRPLDRYRAGRRTSILIPPVSAASVDCALGQAFWRRLRFLRG